MPSLRRIASSPAVRRYPACLSATSSTGSSSAARLQQRHGFRRSSDSEVSTRRVLADLEWWKVVDGQCDSYSSQQEDQNVGQDLDDQPGHRLVMDALYNGAGVVNIGSSSNVLDGGDAFDAATPNSLVGTSPEAPSAWTSTFVEPVQTEQVPTASRSPRTPIRRYNTEPSLFMSSAESTPESASPMMEDSRFAFSDFELGAELVIPEWTPPEFELEQKKDAPSLFFGAYEYPQSVPFDDTFGPYHDYAISPFSLNASDVFGFNQGF
ncbi:hypothetical protein BDN72DRAFT_862261 [Pluteus cervinus]|uniref:Uncharacterized protein n=1 Tax=Pluteus cervinus TaxID=181527 RepID=A0ACD3ACJ7_9AGAR|nr:hypothetical protein BDN72DRAFT_862261 [Pluteus cervinus]